MRNKQRCASVVAIAATLSVLLIAVVRASAGAPADGDNVTRIVYFYAEKCVHCQTVIREILLPLQARYGERLEVKMIEVSDPAHYEMLVRAEELFGVAPEERGLPTLIVGNRVLIGEEAIREELLCIVETCMRSSGTSWPDIPGLETVPLLASEMAEGSFSTELSTSGGVGTCNAEQPDTSVCADLPPIRLAYFYQLGCSECDRATLDIQYIENRYPQVIVDEFNIFDHLALAEWLARRAGRSDDVVHAPAVFIGNDALIGAKEVTPQNLEWLIQKYLRTGAEAAWTDYQPTTVMGANALSIGTIVLAGLLDGLNPCAFATLIFFISYLTLTGRRGWQVLAVGGAFTLGVFLAYLAIGLGLYRFLDLVRAQHAAAARWLYALTGLLCAVFAILSFTDFLKARRGQVDNMALVLPESLRKRIHATIRASSRARAFVAGAFVTGLVVSLLELACTGQVYFATLVSMVNMPSEQLRALPLLVLYCLMFIVPLLVVFVLVYLGTSSIRLGVFLRRHTATIKLVTALLFAVFAGWLLASLVRRLL